MPDKKGLSVIKNLIFFLKFVETNLIALPLDSAVFSLKRALFFVRCFSSDFALNSSISFKNILLRFAY